MKLNFLIKTVVGIAAFAMVILLITKVIAEPLIERRIRAALTEKTDDSLITIQKVQVSILHSEVEFENIGLRLKSENEEQPGLSGEIETVRFKGIQLIAVLARYPYTTFQPKT
jgi:hypothetical protein